MKRRFEYETQRTTRGRVKRSIERRVPVDNVRLARAVLAATSGLDNIVALFERDRWHEKTVKERTAYEYAVDALEASTSIMKDE